MPDHGVAVEELLVIEPLGQKPPGCGGANQRGLIREHQLLCPDKRPGFFKNPGLAAPLHVEQEHTGVDVVWVNEIFPIVIPGGGVFHGFHVQIVKQADVLADHNVRVQVQ